MDRTFERIWTKIKKIMVHTFFQAIVRSIFFSSIEPLKSHSIYKLDSKLQISTTKSSLSLFTFEIVHYRSKGVNPCPTWDYLPAFPPSPKVVTAAQVGFPCKNLVRAPRMSNLDVFFHFFFLLRFFLSYVLIKGLRGPELGTLSL